MIGEPEWAHGLCRYPQRQFRYLFERVERRAPPDAEVVTAYTDGVVTFRRNRRLDGYHEAASLDGFKGVAAGDFVVHGLDILRGSVGISDSTGAISAVCITCRPRAGIEPRFFAYVLRAQAWSGYTRAFARGVREGGADFRRWATLGDLRLPAPPHEVQCEIADFLDAQTSQIDALIEGKQRLAALLAERFASEATQRVLGGLDPVTGQGRMDELWRRPRLGVALELRRGFDLPYGERREGVVPVVSSGGISGWHDTAACKPPGVVTGRYGTVGGVHFVEMPYWPLNTTLFVSDFRGNDPQWVYHLLRALPLNIDEEKSAVTGINRNVVGQMFVPLPPQAVQRELAAELSKAEEHQLTLGDRLARQIDLLREHRQALVTAAVIGQLAVARSAA